KAVHLAVGRRHGGLLFLAHLAFPDLVETQIRNYAVQPGVKAAIEAECMQIAVDAQERLLIHVAGIFLRTEQIQRQTQHRLIIEAYELLKRFAIAALSCADKGSFVLPLRRAPSGDFSERVYS